MKVVMELDIQFARRCPLHNSQRLDHAFSVIRQSKDTRGSAVRFDTGSSGLVGDAGLSQQ